MNSSIRQYPRFLRSFDQDQASSLPPYRKVDVEREHRTSCSQTVHVPRTNRLPHGGIHRSRLYPTGSPVIRNFHRVFEITGLPPTLPVFLLLLFLLPTLPLRGIRSRSNVVVLTNASFLRAARIGHARYVVAAFSGCIRLIKPRRSACQHASAPIYLRVRYALPSFSRERIRVQTTHTESKPDRCIFFLLLTLVPANDVID